MRGGQPRLPIRRHLFTYFALLVLAVALSTFLCFYLMVAPSLRQSALDLLQESARTQMRLVDQSIRSMNNVSVNTLYSARILAAVSHMNRHGKLPYEMQRDMIDQLVAINGPMLPVAQIRIYAQGGVMFATGIQNGQYTYDAASLPWLEEVYAKDGAKMLFPPETMRFSADSAQYIPLRRAIKATHQDPVGIIEVLTNANAILGSLGNQRASIQTLVLNSRGEIVFARDEKMAATLAGWEAVRADSGTGEYQDQFVAWQHAVESDWVLLTVQPQAVALQPMRAITVATLGIACALLALALGLSYVAAGKFVRPVEGLAQRMRDFHYAQQEGGAPEPTGPNELVMLSDSFDSLKVRLTHSVDALMLAHQQELQSRMLALQSQMNPHFLHNALSNLEALVEMGETEKATAMIGAMSRMLRYIASDAQSVVPLAEELAHVRDYVLCMQLRYGENLTFQLDIQEDIDTFCLPKLTIQPLVENAIKYGCTGQPPWRISLQIGGEGTRRRVTVWDTGPGFQEETLRALRAQLADVAQRGVLPRMEIDGMGLLNIAMRLKLYAGGQGTLLVDSPPEGGGYVCMLWEEVLPDGCEPLQDRPV